MATNDEVFNPAALQRSDTLNSTITVASKTLPSLNTKSSRPQSHPRIDFEPLYADLKALIGHNNWGVYSDALTRIIRGELSSAEFSDLTDNFLLATPATEHAHNQYVCAILHNATRDVPDPGTAAFVSAASDKSSGAAPLKPAITSDAAEQRLKTEIKKLPRRDRVRIKGISAEKSEEESLASRRNGYEDYYQASRIKAPDNIPASSGGLTKTNWELEIKKRYVQPLFSETIEFPDAGTIYSRMVPICYEEAIASGSSMQCAELVGVAAEMYVKDLLGTIFNRTRSNGPRYENTNGGGILTGAYQKQIDRDEADVRSGKIQKDRENDLLPVESREATSRRPLGMSDMKLASTVVRGLWNGMPMIGAQIMEAPLESEQDDWRAERALRKPMDSTPATNGIMTDGEVDAENDDNDYGWEGSGSADKEALGSLLEDCLAIRT